MDRLFRPISASWLVALRILFGAAMAVSMLRFLAYGWVHRFFVEPEMHFKYWGFEWVPAPPPDLAYPLFWALFTCAACMTVGLLFRLTAGLFTLGLLYVQLIDVSTYLNHYYLAVLLSFLLALSPAGRFLSVDASLRQAWLRRRGRGSSPPQLVPVFWLYWFRFQVAVVYCFAGLAKLNSDWLLHAQPLRIWLGTQTDLPVLGPLFTIEGMPLLMSWAGFLFDSTIVIWLSWRRTRVAAYAVVVVFHILTRVLFPIGMFPVIMTVAALVFFEPSWPMKAAATVKRWAARSSFGRPSLAARQEATHARGGSEAEVPVASDSWRRRALVVGAACYCALQVALPLRFLAYGGNVMWHEQGMRFAWRVMLRAKGGQTVFHVTDGTNRTTYVQPRQYLTDLQEAEMVSQPDLILQLAHHIRDDFERRGARDVVVRVDARANLNGRRAARLIDPAIDLAREHDGLGRLAWVLAAPSEAPPHTRPVL